MSTDDAPHDLRAAVLQAAGPPPAPVAFVRDMDPRHGEAVEVATHLRRVTCRNPGPFTFLGTNSFIVGRGEVAVVDPGPDDAEHLAALLRAVEGERVVAVLVTHTHADHSPLARRLAEAVGGPPVLGRADPAIETGELTADTAFRPDAELADGARIAAGKLELEAIASPGHASNHLCFALGDLLLSGDHVMGWSTTIVAPPDGDMDAYLASLEATIARRFATIHPAHGPPIDDPAPFMDAYRAHRLHREAQVRAAVAHGLAHIPRIVEVLYADLPPSLHPAAARSVWAHLIRLVRRGDAIADGGPALDALYRPA